MTADVEQGGQTRLDAAAHDSATVNQVAGDQVNIHRCVQSASAPSPAPVHVVHGLRAGLATFTGRAEQIREITDSIATTTSGVVTIHAIDGMPGVGKTALARHVAHLLAGRFPDGQLFVDLHAHSVGQAPADPGEVLAGLLAATGLAPEHIPDGVEARADCWRGRMAGRRVLLVLDNAATGDQVAPLLPGSSGCLVLITSRRRLAGLRRDYGATSLPLGVMPESEAVALFARVCPHPLDVIGKGVVVGLVRLCGYLPLAVTILAASIHADQDSTASDLLAELEAAQDRLASIDEYRDGQELGVASAFDLSYQRLTVEQQRVLRMVSLTPGADVDPYAAAALTGLPLATVRRHLRDLYTHHLIDQPTHHRYRLHDLINLYAHSRTGVEESDRAIGRLLDFYQHTAAISAAWIRRGPCPNHTTAPVCTTPVPELPDQVKATRWLRAERTNLLACLDHTRQHGDHTRTVNLTAGLAPLLRRHGPWTGGIDLQIHALAIFRNLGDRHGEAYTLTELGTLHTMTGDYSQAAIFQEQALSIRRDLGDRNGEAWALAELGTLRRLADDYVPATDLHEQALTLFRDLGDRNGEAYTLAELGVLRRLTGDYPRATILVGKALTHCRDSGNRIGEAYTLAELGTLRRMTGDYLQATVLQEQALSIRRDLGDRNGEAWALAELGALRRMTGDWTHATNLLEQALTLFRELGERNGEAEVLNHQGNLLRVLGAPNPARACHAQALQLARDTSSVLEEARALAGVGRCDVATGVVDGVTNMRRAAEMLQRIGAAEASELTTEIETLG